MTTSLRALLPLFLLSLAFGPQCHAQNSPRVAVLNQPGFPFFGPPTLLSPAAIAADLSRAGVSAKLLDADALAAPGTLTTQNYAAVILPYGNTYPQEDFQALLAFHRAGGILVTDSIPFTHPVQRQGPNDWHDLGNDSDPELFGPGEIGVGGFRGGPEGPTTVPAADPLGLKPLHIAWGDGSSAQALDPATIPASDQVVPILTAGGSPTAALIVHHNDGFDGAVDVWTANSLKTDDPALAAVTEQLLARGTIAALTIKGLIGPDRDQVAFRILDRLHIPFPVADLVLPTPPRPYPTLQPKTPPPARHLYVADVSHLPQDQQLLLSCLQGLVNRTQPRIYLIFSDDDRFWLNAMQQQGSTDAPIPVSDPMSLLTTFRSAYAGAVLPDPKVYTSPCVAVDLAGIDNLLIATPALAAQLHLPIKADLCGRFKDDADGMRYARTHLLSRLNPYLSLCLDPVLLGSQVDDVIAARGMAFWVTGPKAQNEPGANEAAERAELETTFSELPLDAVVRGFWWHGDGVGLDETPGVALGSNYGKVTTVSDYVANFSVMSGVRLPALKQRVQPPTPAFDPAKVYLAFTMSDGDNLCTWRGYFRQYFTDPLHGTLPIGWGMGPSLLDVAPTEARWYYEHAAPTDEFLCDVTGVGYIYPPAWATRLKDRSGAFAQFYGWTQKYTQRLDMHTMRLMNVTPPDIAQAGRDMPELPFLMPDYGYQGEASYSQFTYTLPTGQPVFRSMTFGSDAQDEANQIRSRIGSARPAFVNAFMWNWGNKLSNLKQILTDLGPQYVAVTPSQLNALYRQAEARGLVKQAANREK